MSIKLLVMVTWLLIRASGLHSTVNLRLPSVICSTGRFWFFAARNNPDNAPLVTWFNGGVSNYSLLIHFSMLKESH